jgi:hypothetical protein
MLWLQQQLWCDTKFHYRIHNPISILPSRLRLGLQGVFSLEDSKTVIGVLRYYFMAVKICIVGFRVMTPNTEQCHNPDDHTTGTRYTVNGFLDVS